MIKILSIDDSRAVHAYLDDCLRKTKVALEHAYGGAEGIELARQRQFDLILLDWEMPGLSGPDVLLEIRRSRIGIPIIMLTSRNEPEGISKMLENGVSEYIMKPFTADILLSKIESVIGKAVQLHVAE